MSVKCKFCTKSFKTKEAVEKHFDKDHKPHPITRRPISDLLHIAEMKIIEERFEKYFEANFPKPKYHDSDSWESYEWNKINAWNTWQACYNSFRKI